MSKRLWLTMLLVVSSSMQAQDWQDAPEQQEAEWRQAQADAHRAYSLRVAEALAKGGDARELAFAALLRSTATRVTDAMPDGDGPSRPVPADATVASWLRAADAKAGGDILANQLLMAAAGNGSGRAAAAARWQAADPGNLVPLLFQDLAVDRLLVEARRATRADARMYEGVRWMQSALARHPPTEVELSALAGDQPFHVEEAGAVMGMALWAAQAMPGYGGLAQACRGTALRATPTRVADCRHVARLLAVQSDNGMAMRVGLAMLGELATDDAERAAIAAQQRRMDWQMLQWGRVAQQQPRDGAEQFARLLRDPAIRSEQQMVERVLQEAGIALEPPAGWQPPRY